jgi:hypothetical protein
MALKEKRQRIELMSQVPGDDDGDAGGGPQGRARQKKRVNVEIQLADAQKALARATEKNARYLLWAVVIATLSTLVSTAGVLYVLSAG